MPARRRYLPLFARVGAINVLLLLAAVAVTRALAHAQTRKAATGPAFRHVGR